MTWIDRLEKRLGWLTFPAFLKYYALFQVMVFLLQAFRPGLGQLLDFDRDRILSGEVWRLVTFPFATAAYTPLTVFRALLMICVTMFTFSMSDSLENAWGEFKTTLYHFTGILGILIANFLLPISYPGSGWLIYLASFFAFATLFPRYEMLFMLIIPVQVRFLAMIACIPIVLFIIALPAAIPYFLLALGNYLLFAGVPALKNQGSQIAAGSRRRKFASKSSPTDAFHTCATCARTEVSDPTLEFRIHTDGQEYCTDHLPE